MEKLFGPRCFQIRKAAVLPVLRFGFTFEVLLFNFWVIFLKLLPGFALINIFGAFSIDVIVWQKATSIALYWNKFIALLGSSKLVLAGKALILKRLVDRVLKVYHLLMSNSVAVHLALAKLALDEGVHLVVVCTGLMMQTYVL